MSQRYFLPSKKEEKNWKRKEQPATTLEQECSVASVWARSSPSARSSEEIAMASLPASPKQLPHEACGYPTEGEKDQHCVEPASKRRRPSSTSSGNASTPTAWESIPSCLKSPSTWLNRRSCKSAQGHPRHAQAQWPRVKARCLLVPRPLPLWAPYYSQADRGLQHRGHLAVGGLLLPWPCYRRWLWSLQLSGAAAMWILVSVLP